MSVGKGGEATKALLFVYNASGSQLLGENKNGTKSKIAGSGNHVTFLHRT